MDLQFEGKYIITGKIICETGLHLGGIQEGIEIGGVENIVIRDAITDFPYIPGSSLKGKLRHLLEWELNKVFKDEKGEYPAHSCENNPEVIELKLKGKGLQGEEKKKNEQEIEKKLTSSISNCAICKIFGSSATAGGTPTRLIVRDAFPTGYENAENPPENSTVWKWKQWLGENIYTEIKMENTIDRVTSEANPRHMERVPAGSEFVFEMIFDIYRNEDKELLKSVFAAMHLLENSAIGGSGSRGYGKIKFADLKLSFRSKGYYLGEASEEIAVEVKRDKAEQPTKFILTGKTEGEVSFKESIVKLLQSKLDTILA